MTRTTHSGSTTTSTRPCPGKPSSRPPSAERGTAPPVSVSGAGQGPAVSGEPEPVSGEPEPVAGEPEPLSGPSWGPGSDGASPPLAAVPLPPPLGWAAIAGPVVIPAAARAA